MKNLGCIGWPILHFFEKRVVRFLISGGLNTIATYGIYLFLLNWFGYKPSYSVAFILGILMSYIGNRFFVFKSHQGIKTVLLFPLVYLLQYFVGLAVLWIWIDFFHLNPQLGPLITILVSIPLTYLVSKLFFIGRQA